jgi:hypothetical protein
LDLIQLEARILKMTNLLRQEEGLLTVNARRVRARVDKAKEREVNREEKEKAPSLSISPPLTDQLPTGGGSAICSN